MKSSKLSAILFITVNNPAASSGAWNLMRPKGRGIDPRGIRQANYVGFMLVQAVAQSQQADLAHCLRE